MCQNKSITNIYGSPCSETTSGYTITGYCKGPQTCCATSYKAVGGEDHSVTNCSATILQTGQASAATTQTSGSSVPKTGAAVSSDQAPGTAPNSPANPSAGSAAANANSATAVSANQIPAQSSNGSAAPLSSAAAANSGTTINNGSIGANANNSIGTSNLTSGPILSSGQPATQPFNGNSNLGTVARGGITTGSSGSFNPVAGGSGSNIGTFSATRSTFGSGGSGVSYSSGGNSSLTSVFSSFGSIASNPLSIGSDILSFFTGLLSTANNSSGSSQGQAPPQTVVVPVLPEQQIAAQTLPQNPQTTQQSGSRLTSDQYYEFPSIADTNTADQSSFPQLTSIINGQPQVTLDDTGNAAQGPEAQNILSPLLESSESSLSENPIVGSSTLTQFASGFPSTALDMVESLSGEWTYSSQHLNDEKSLAQAQSNYEGLVAEEQALQAAENANVCNDNCESSLAMVQAEIPAEAQEVQQLTATVNEPVPTNFGQSPSDIVAQLTGFAPQQADLVNNSPSAEVQSSGSAQSSGQAPSLSELAAQQVPSGPPIVVQAPLTPPNFTPLAPSAPQEDNASFSEEGQPYLSSLDPVEQAVANIWNKVQSWFEPVATSTAARSQSCSLFASLFGGCKGW